MKKSIPLFCLLVAGLMSLTATAATKKGHLAGTVNVNQASISELSMLPGIGQKRAEEIVAYRTATPFQSPDELKNIKGIGDKSLESLRPFVTTDGPTTAQWVKE